MTDQNRTPTEDVASFFGNEPQAQRHREDLELLDLKAEEECRNLETAYLRRGLPWPLANAVVDPFPFGYAVGLRGGVVVYFERASMRMESPDFITLKGIKAHSVRPADQDMPRLFSFDHGLTVRIADIMWAADAPYGSGEP